jgi:hypothetical protein
MSAAVLPGEVEAVFANFLTCEFATVGKDGRPVAWPIMPTYWPERQLFVLASPIALAQKAANARRNPRVSLLFSHPIGSGLECPPAVLVQGDARVMDGLVTKVDDIEPALLPILAAQGRRLYHKQPGLRLYVANPLTRYVMAWYFIRQFVFVSPRRITWWPAGDFDAVPETLEVPHVETDFALSA